MCRVPAVRARSASSGIVPASCRRCAVSALVPSDRIAVVEPEQPGLLDLLEQALLDQRPDDPVRGALADPDAAGELADPELGAVLVELAQDPRRGRDARQSARSTATRLGHRPVASARTALRRRRRRRSAVRDDPAGRELGGEQRRPRGRARAARRWRARRPARSGAGRACRSRSTSRSELGVLVGQRDAGVLGVVAAQPAARGELQVVDGVDDRRALRRTCARSSSGRRRGRRGPGGRRGRRTARSNGCRGARRSAPPRGPTGSGSCWVVATRCRPRDAAAATVTWPAATSGSEAQLAGREVADVVEVGACGPSRRSRGRRRGSPRAPCGPGLTVACWAARRSPPQSALRDVGSQTCVPHGGTVMPEGEDGDLRSSACPT